MAKRWTLTEDQTVEFIIETERMRNSKAVSQGKELFDFWKKWYLKLDIPNTMMVEIVQLSPIVWALDEKEVLK
jgi:hypothetical protein